MIRRAFRPLAPLPFLLLALAPGMPARAADPPAGLRNPGFEEGAAGAVPPGWELTPRSTAAGYSAVFSEERPAEGKRAALLSSGTAPIPPYTAGTLRQSLDAALYRGKRVRLRASVHTDGQEAGTAQIFLGVDRPGITGGVDATSAAVDASAWTAAQAIADVPADAQKIHLGLQLVGSGRAFFDGVSLEVVGEAGGGNEPPRPLSACDRDNLVAFTRLFGLVRFFHPSDQVAAADWKRLALAGVQRAEGARDAAELARVLEAIFRPLAPTLRVAAGGRPALPPELAAPAAGAGLALTSWEHLGVKLGKTPSIYESTRFVVTPGAPPPGAVTYQWIGAKPFHGRTVRLAASVRGDAPGVKVGRLSLAAVRFQPGGVDIVRLAEANADVDVDGTWKAVETRLAVPDDAGALEIGVGLAGGGRVSWDDVVLTTEGAAPALPAPAAADELSPALANPGFEEETDAEKPAPEGWQIKRESTRAGYRLADCPAPHGGSRCLALAFTPPSAAELPHPDEPLVVDLGGGVTALVPLALYRDAQGTLPRVAPGVQPPAPDKPESFVVSGNDRATRLADVALAWTVFEHFYPYFDVVGVNWAAELPRALAAAATDADELAFLKTLRRLVAALEDGHGGVYFPREKTSHALPLAWASVEDRLVITRVAPSAAAAGGTGLAAGDVVQAIDGRPTAEVLTELEEMTAGATPQWRRYRAVEALRWGAEGEETRLAVRHANGEAATVALRHTLSYDEPFAEARPEKIAEVRPGIFYVDIDRINDADFKGALDRLAAARGIVFDLRGYPGHLSPVVLAHLTDRPVTSARWDVPVVTRPDRQGVRFDFSNWSVPPEKPRLTAKVAFLIDGRAISYAETYLGIVENYHLAALVGSPTAGTNGNVNPFSLPGGYNVAWTGMKVLKHDGSRHHGVGIHPTVPVQRTIAGVAAGRDEILDKGIEVVSP